MSDLARFEFFITVVSVILTLALVAKYLRLPTSVAFIGGGICMVALPWVPNITIDPDLILVMFLPPLLMSGAYFTVWSSFRENLLGILQLAVGAVFFTTLIVGVVTHFLVPSLPWSVCFALGAILAPPDAVAAKSVLTQVKLPERLTTLMEGESLLNDASSLVIYRVAISSFLTGTFSIVHATISFAVLSIGGLLLGGVLAYFFILILRRISDPLIVICLTLLGPWMAYIIGDRIGVSGVMATVTMGLMFGWRQHDIFGARTRVEAGSFWALLIFLMEALIFVTIGLGLRSVFSMGGNLFATKTALFTAVAGVILATIVARFLWVYAAVIVSKLVSKIFKLNWTFSHDEWKHATIIGWTGMRGVVSLAVALSTPSNMPGREFVLLCAFVLILITVVGQGTTLGVLIRCLGIKDAQDDKNSLLNIAQARLKMASAQREEIEKLAISPTGKVLHPRLLEQYRFRENAIKRYNEQPSVFQPEKEAHYQTLLKIVAKGREELLKLHKAGRIHDSVVRQLEYELDLQEMSAEVSHR
ncbi:cation:proton antiporter [Swingsia samuiensis]|uniref:Sodium:proton antiporter n=1 Tax=Swingsia samuiensis TaxID=1293412 RepID=A0A4Y6UJH2_9PROT|nr:sodium:proton antiporter [Swingsia samuiensis]QDH16616.1 sodium:proton antiporter [Swingsia samuiensis]